MRKRLAVVVLFAVMIMMFAVPVAADTYRYVALDSQSGTSPRKSTIGTQTIRSALPTFTRLSFQLPGI